MSRAQSGGVWETAAEGRFWVGDFFFFPAAATEATRQGKGGGSNETRQELRRWGEAKEVRTGGGLQAWPGAVRAAAAKHESFELFFSSQALPLAGRGREWVPKWGARTSVPLSPRQSASTGQVPSQRRPNWAREAHSRRRMGLFPFSFRGWRLVLVFTEQH